MQVDDSLRIWKICPNQISDQICSLLYCHSSSCKYGYTANYLLNNLRALLGRFFSSARQSNSCKTKIKNKKSAYAARAWIHIWYVLSIHFLPPMPCLFLLWEGLRDGGWGPELGITPTLGLNWFCLVFFFPLSFPFLPHPLLSTSKGMRAVLKGWKAGLCQWYTTCRSQGHCIPFRLGLTPYGDPDE